jgi:ubiquitin-protein ligase
MGLTSSEKLPDERGGSVTPWTAISATIQQIQTVAAFAKWTKRILLITDGDAPIDDTAIAACQSLLKTDIILDALVLGPMSPIRMAVFYSGGRAFGLDGPEFREFLKLEEFIDISVRLRPHGNWKPAEITKKLLTIHAESPPYDTTVGLKNPYTKLVPSVIPEKLSGTSYRERRIVEELETCRKGVPTTFDIALGNDRLDLWFVSLEGPLSRHDGLRVLWPLTVLFPPDYPYSCPTFRFAAVPSLVNICPSGRVVCSALKNYNPRVSIASLLCEIQHLFTDKDTSVYPEVSSTGVDEWTMERLFECQWQRKMGPKRCLKKASRVQDQNLDDDEEVT